MNISRSARLHWLNILGNWALGVQGGASVRGWGGTQDTPLASSPWPHPMLAAMMQPPPSRGTGQ